MEEAGVENLTAEFVALRIMAKQRIGQIVGRAMRYEILMTCMIAKRVV